MPRLKFLFKQGTRKVVGGYRLRIKCYIVSMKVMIHVLDLKGLPFSYLTPLRWSCSQIKDSSSFLTSSRQEAMDPDVSRRMHTSRSRMQPNMHLLPGDANSGLLDLSDEGDSTCFLAPSLQCGVAHRIV